MKSFALGIAGTLALAGFSSSAMAVSVVTTSGSVGVSATASMADGNFADVQTFQSDWAGAPAPSISTSGSALATSTAGSNITAGGSSYADWDPNGLSGSGNIALGWGFNVFPGDDGVFAAFNGNNWSYTFTPDSNSLFSLKYNIVGHDQMFGLQGWMFRVDGSDVTNLSGPNFVFDPTNSGFYTYALTGGTTYTLSLGSAGNISKAGTFMEYFGNQTAAFSWSISDLSAPVPEPSSWMMMIAGFGLAGSAMRRTKKAQATVIA